MTSAVLVDQRGAAAMLSLYVVDVDVDLDLDVGGRGRERTYSEIN